LAEGEEAQNSDSDKPIFASVHDAPVRKQFSDARKMTLQLRSPLSLILLFAIILSSLFSAWPLPPVHASSPPYSQVYITPVTSCCGSPDKPYGVNEVFTVDIDLDLTSGEVFNGFDIRINYTNPHSGVSQGVLTATRIDYSTNIFSTYGNTIVEQCIDGVAVNNGVGCTTDFLGQVHFGQFVLGRTFSGPLFAQQLFRITFQVTGFGTSLFLVDRGIVVNPTPDPSNPGQVSPQYIPVLKATSIFSNIGVTAFFDYQPNYSQDTILSPSLLPNQPASFDATHSFVANDSLMAFKSYYWDFGDTANLNTTSTVVNHTFSVAANYTVTLTVTDNKGQTGTISRLVMVLPALGNIALTIQDQAGTLQRGNVRIKVFNSSLSSLPFFNRTSDGNGQTTIYNLVPGSYYLTFSGPGIVSGSKSETAIPGFTRQDTVHVSLVQQPPDYSGLIYVGTILGGLAIISAVIMYQKAKARRESKRLRGQSSVLSRTRKGRASRVQG
jgi:PKD domain